MDSKKLDDAKVWPSPGGYSALGGRGGGGEVPALNPAIPHPAPGVWPRQHETAVR